MPELSATAASRAVFLSYAREDHQAARRIADALRGFGVEVWFDQSELRGGDAWDQKIRKQIKDCALFVPVVSQHTQERGEGYFRLEWKLAVERTHQMAEGIPFLTPVAIDQAHEADALVPPEFMRVHWTRLPDGTPTPQFLEQVKRLLDSPRKSTATRKAESAGSQFSVAPIPPATPVAPATSAPVARPAVPAPRAVAPAAAKPRVSLWFNLALGAVTLALVAYIVRRPTAQETPSALAPAKPVAEAKAAAPSPSTNNPSPAAAAPTAASVAVLAFADLSAAHDSEYFSDGISEELLNVLAKVPGLKVTARTSSFYFKGKQVPMAEIARQLGVAYVVEGSVRKAGDKIRITAQLIKAADGFHVWSDTFTRDLKDIFAVQDEIAGLVAKQLSLKLGTGSAGRTTSVDPQAFELYVQARQAWNLRNDAGYAQAEQLLNRALALAPDFARAHAALADVWYFQTVASKRITGTFARPEPPEFSRILAKVRQALALDGESAEAHASLGNVLTSSWRFAEAEQAYRRAIALNPNYASAHQWLASLILFDGRIDEGLAEAKLASSLDPLSSRIADNHAFAHLLAGHYREALAINDRAIALQPSNFQALAQKAVVLACLGRTEEAVALARQLPASVPITPSVQLIVYAKAGSRREAEALLPATQGKDYWDPSHTLLVLGRKEDAIATLDPGSCENPGYSLHVEYDLLDDDPRFQKFIATLGWTEARARMKAWRAAHPPEKPEAKK